MFYFLLMGKSISAPAVPGINQKSIANLCNFPFTCNNQTVFEIDFSSKKRKNADFFTRKISPFRHFATKTLIYR